MHDGTINTIVERMIKQTRTSLAENKRSGCPDPHMIDVRIYRKREPKGKTIRYMGRMGPRGRILAVEEDNEVGENRSEQPFLVFARFDGRRVIAFLKGLLK